MLTRTRLTDTSSGLRLMRAELTGTVTQTQPQYQTSELLIGALLQSYRVAEVPTVMRQRLSGESKKGRNLAYGLRLRPRHHADVPARAAGAPARRTRRGCSSSSSTRAATPRADYLADAKRAGTRCGSRRVGCAVLAGGVRPCAGTIRRE